MSPEAAVDLCREAMLTCLMLGAPLLLVGMLVGLAVSFLQALTQVQDQTVSLVPKILAMLAAIGLLLPWLLQHLVDYSTALITNIPQVMLGG
jgi:flagellar biosynthesis protein FliQ